MIARNRRVLPSPFRTAPGCRRRFLRRRWAQLAILGGLCFFLVSRVCGCELLGFSFNQTVPAGRLFAVFCSHGVDNPDGWGMAFYADRSAAVFKEPQNAVRSKLVEFLVHYPSFQAPLLIAHIRNASVGQVSHQNTHPFLRELGGREYALVHNGTLKDYKDKLKLYRIKPVGQTDSEFLLCYLLGRIEQRDIVEWRSDAFQWLQGELRAANQTGSVNCLFSDGVRLFVYRDANGVGTLHYLVRRAQYGQAARSRAAPALDINRDLPASAIGVVVATKPLTAERWTPATPGRLMVFENGAQKFPAQ